MPLFIYAFLFTLNAVKLCWGETFYLRDLKLYDHSMLNKSKPMERLSFKICMIFTFSQNHSKSYIILSMAMVSMNQIKKKVEIINL